MARWMRTLDLSDMWERAGEGEIPTHELAGVAAARLRAMKPFSDVWVDEERLEIADEFQDLSEDAETGFEEFNSVMTRLYDWADQKISGEFFDAKKACWVKTFF
jgi:hypothetical protein